MGKTILITGAASELGQNVAESLGGAGHRVFAAMRDPFARNRKAADGLWARGIEVVTLDVTDDASVASAVKAVVEKATRIDVVVNNARIAMIGAVEAFTPAQVQDVLNTNVVGAMRTAQAVLPSMRRAGAGLIVNIGSVLGRVALPFFGIHGASKFALEALTDSLRYELVPTGIDVVLLQQSVSPASARLVAIAGGGEPADAPPDGRRHARALGQISARLEMARAPDPRAVSDAIRALVDMPFGSRPCRLVVGDPLGADRLNRMAETLQREALEALSRDGFETGGDLHRPMSGKIPDDPINNLSIDRD
jgi:NAD(P)-dependent dehydrogenase (short-subunit alcohol dehydrogenase family)